MTPETEGSLAADADDLVPDGVLVDETVVLISVGPATELATNVVGIEVRVTTTPNGTHGRVFLYQWTGEVWRPATSDETGITIATSVS